MDSAFYSPQGDRFVSSELTRGPWDPDSQHAGPPTALIARELECTPAAIAPDASWQFGRITFEILRPVPIAPLTVSTEVVRPGRSVELLAATLAGEEGEPLIRATAWRVVRAAVELPFGLAGEDAGSPARPSSPLAPPADGSPESSSKPGRTTATTRRWSTDFSPGAFSSRARQPCGCGCESRWSPASSRRPLQRVLTAADSGNGVSAALDWSRFLFINVDLSVHLHRMPATEWVCLDAITVPEPTGIGLADTALHDERGPIGRALQTLRRRHAGRGRLSLGALDQLGEPRVPGNLGIEQRTEVPRSATQIPNRRDDRAARGVRSRPRARGESGRSRCDGPRTRQRAPLRPDLILEGLADQTRVGEARVDDGGTRPERSELEPQSLARAADGGVVGATGYVDLEAKSAPKPKTPSRTRLRSRSRRRRGPSQSGEHRPFLGSRAPLRRE